MAIDVCSEISSPRISFSYDLNHKREDKKLDKSLILDSDFDFCSFVQEQEWSCADELFSNGKILPIEIKKCKPISSSSSSSPSNKEKKQLKEFLSMSIEDEEDEDEEKTCKNGVLIRSLQFFSRSNSTPNPSKQQKKPELKKQYSVPQRKSPAKLYPYNYYSGQHKSPALRKCGSYGNANNTYRISPVLNISAGTVNLFGLASLFGNTKVKPNKR